MSDVHRNPLGVADDDYERIQGGEARAVNTEAGVALAETVRTTLGPKGMDKMLIDSLGDVVVTNDGATILREFDIENPAAEIVADVANSQADELGDGTTTAVVIAGALLGRAGDLFEDGMHPTTVIRGYNRALDHAREVSEDRAVTVEDDAGLRSLATTAITGSAVDSHIDEIARLVVEAVHAVTRDGIVDVEDIQLEAIVGGSPEESELIDGTVFDEVPVHPNMSDRFDDAGVAVFNCELDPVVKSVESNVVVEDTDVMRKFAADRLDRAEAIADRIAEAGVDVVLVGKEIDTDIAEFLSQNGILAAEEVSDDALTRVKGTTGADIVSTFEAFSADNVGYAGRVEVAEINYENHFFFEECRDPESVVLLVRTGTSHTRAEMERALADAISVISHAVEDGRVSPGGGAFEMAVSLAVRNRAEGVGSREQLAMDAFADALETIPRTLAATAGMDPVDTMVALRRKHSEEGSDVGVDVEGATVGSMTGAGVLEPTGIKLQALSTAVQAATTILRVDDIFEAEELPDVRENGSGDR